MIPAIRSAWSLVSSPFRRSPITAQDAEPGKPPPDLEKIIVPQARDRWRGARISHYTPTTIENVLTAAFSGDLRAQWELFDLMEETWPRLGKDLNELKRSVQSLDWTLQPWAEKGEEPTDRAVERAQFVEGLLWKMDPVPTRAENDFEQTIYDVLDAWGKGTAVLEIDWEQRAGVVAPRCTRWIHPRYYGYPWENDELMLNTSEINSGRARSDGQSDRINGSLARIDGVMAGQWVQFPQHKFIVAMARHKSGHPIGAALLRPLAWWWCAANFGAEWLLNYAQLFGQPIRWATYDPARKNLLTQISDMMRNLGSAGWAVFPDGTQLELKEAAKSGQDNPQAFLLTLADKTADLVILGQTLTSDVGASGSRALGEVHEGVRGDVFSSAAEWSAGTLKQLIRAICWLNYGNAEDCPWLAPSAREVKDAKGLADRDSVLLNAGVVMPRQWFYERHDIPVPAEDEEVIRTLGVPAPEPPGAGGDTPPDATATAGDAASASASGGDVQATALNGAQVTALASLAEKVAAGLLPVDTALSIAIASFPLVPPATIQKIFGALRNFTPRPEPTAPAPVPPPMRGRAADRRQALRAQAAEEAEADVADIVQTAVADSVAARREWLAPLKSALDTLVRAAQSGEVTEEQLTRFAEQAAEAMPSLFRDLDRDALADSITAALGAATLEGARAGVAKRTE